MLVQRTKPLNDSNSDILFDKKNNNSHIISIKCNNFEKLKREIINDNHNNLIENKFKQANFRDADFHHPVNNMLNIKEIHDDS